MSGRVTLVDVVFLPFLERIVASMLYFKGIDIRTSEYPNISAWFDGMEELEGYGVLVRATTTSTRGTCLRSWAGALRRWGAWGRIFAAQSMRSCSRSPPGWWRVGEKEERDECAERLASNDEAVSRFAARGAGRGGFPGFIIAPLADPNAASNEKMAGIMDNVLLAIALEAVGRGEEGKRVLEDV